MKNKQINKQDYHCFSYKQRFYLECLGFEYTNSFLHYKTKNRVWVFKWSNELDIALKAWSYNRRSARKNDFI